MVTLPHATHATHWPLPLLHEIIRHISCRRHAATGYDTSYASTHQSHLLPLNNITIAFFARLIDIYATPLTSQLLLRCCCYATPGCYDVITREERRAIGARLLRWLISYKADIGYSGERRRCYAGYGVYATPYASGLRKILSYVVTLLVVIGWIMIIDAIVT